MGGEELRLLEEKLEHLLLFLSEMRTERDDLLKRTDEQAARISQLEEELGRLREEKGTVREKVASLIARIDQVGISGL
jgi:predicted nuclease with TOPRIM domain